MLRKHFDAPRAAELLTPLAYDPDSRLFYLADGYLGYGFICNPFSGADPKAAERLRVLLNMPWPADTLIQWSLFGNSNLIPTLTRMLNMRDGQSDPLLRNSVQATADFLRQGSDHVIERRTGTMVRDMQLVVTVKIPLANPEPTERDLEEISRYQIQTLQGLETCGLFPVALDRQAYIDVVGAMVNRGPHASWRPTGHGTLSDDKYIRDQVFDYDAAVDLHANGLTLGGETHVRVLSVKRYPTGASFGTAAAYVGDIVRGAAGIREPFCIGVTLYFPDRQKIKQKLETKKTWTTNQAHGPMLKFVPTLAAKHYDFQDLFQHLEDGDRPIMGYLSMTLWAPSESDATAAVSNAVTYWGELGFNLLPDRYICLPLFFQGLPFGADKRLIKDTFRYRTMATKQWLRLLPILGDWRGTGTPVMSFISRNGQLMSVDLFDSSTNYNTVVAAQSGSGKSFLANYLIESYLSVGGKVWVIDVGRSYEKLSDTLDGDFVHFGEDTHICLNPWSNVQDFGDEVDMLAGLFESMAALKEPLSDLQTAGLVRVLSDVWEAKGQEAQVDDVVAALGKEEDQRLRDVGERLFAFSSRGQYGKFFAGKNNVSFRNRFSVLELEELKGKRHLQQVVLLSLVMQIQADMYLGERDRRKIVIIDEAWSLLTEGEVAKFIEHGFRRFRKYGGAAIVITQGVNDLYKSEVGVAIAENSANMMLLGQKPEAISQLKKDERLGLTAVGYERLKSVHTIAGAYSEIFFITDRGAGIGRLIVDEFHQLLYSTKAEDVHAIKQYRDAGLNAADAIRRVMADRKGVSHAA